MKVNITNLLEFLHEILIVFTILLLFGLRIWDKCWVNQCCQHVYHNSEQLPTRDIRQAYFMGHIYKINSHSLRKQRTLSGSQSRQIWVQLKINDVIIIYVQQQKIIYGSWANTFQILGIWPVQKEKGHNHRRKHADNLYNAVWHLRIIIKVNDCITDELHKENGPVCGDSRISLDCVKHSSNKTKPQLKCVLHQCSSFRVLIIWQPFLVT